MEVNRGFLLTAASGILYGTLGFFGTHLSNVGFTVSQFLFWRFLIAALAVFLLQIFRRERIQVDWKAGLFTLLMGVAFYSGSAAFYFLASHWIGTGLAMVVFFTYPAFVLLMARVYDQVPLSRTTLISFVFVFFGLTLIAGKEEFRWDGRGVGLSLIASACYALYVYLSKKRVGQMSTLTNTGLVSLGSMGTFLVFSLQEGSFRWPDSWKVWLLVLGIGLIGTAIPILFLLEGLKTLDAGRASMISVLEPIVTVMIGAILLGEHLTSRQMMGVLIVLMSATYLERSERKPEIQRLTA